MHELAAILFPLVLMLIALLMEKLENLVTHGSGAVSPDQVDSMLTSIRPAAAESFDVAEVALLPTTTPRTANSARRAS